MREEFKAVLIVLICFISLFVNMFTDRNLESEDKDVD